MRRPQSSCPCKPRWDNERITVHDRSTLELGTKREVSGKAPSQLKAPSCNPREEKSPFRVDRSKAPCGYSFSLPQSAGCETSYSCASLANRL